MELANVRGASREEVEHGNPSFALTGNIAFRVVRDRNRIIVRFGELSIGQKFLYSAIGVAGIGIVPLLVNSGVPMAVAVLPTLATLGVFVLVMVRQKSVRGTTLTVEPKRCGFRTRDDEYVWELIERVLVINSRHFRDGSTATEGISEIYLAQEQESGGLRFFPIASGPNYGEYDDLGRTIAAGAKVTLKIDNQR